MIYIPFPDIINFPTCDKFNIKLPDTVRGLWQIDALKTFCDTNNDTIYEIGLRDTYHRYRFDFPVSKLMKYYEEDIELDTCLFGDRYHITIMCFLKVPEGSMPEQLHEIHYNNYVYIPLDKYAETLCPEKMIMRECDILVNDDILKRLMELSIEHKHPNVSWLYRYYKHFQKIPEFIDYIIESEEVPNEDTLIRWLYKACLKKCAKYSEYVEYLHKIYEVCDRNINKDIMNIDETILLDADDLFDMLIIAVSNNFNIKPDYVSNTSSSNIYLPFVIRSNQIFQFGEYVNYKLIYDIYPDIVNNPSRFGWWIACVVPYLIMKQIQCSRYNSRLLYNMAGLIGLWSVMFESGNGCNSWILLHPIKDFEQFATALYLGYYEDVLYLLDVIDDRGHGYRYHLGWDDLIIDRKINYDEIFETIDFNIFMDLYKSIDFIKNIIVKYDIKGDSNKLYRQLNYEDDMIPSPSGMTLLPFVIKQW